jgi:hypothetical protein
MTLMSDSERERIRRERLRREGISGAQAIPGAIREAAGVELGALTGAEGIIQQGAEAAMLGVRQQSAQALGAALSQTGGAGSGASFAQGRQSALTSGGLFADIAAREAGALGQVGVARAGIQAGSIRDAASAELEAIEFEAEAGSEYEEGQELIAAYSSQVASIIERNKGNFVDDEQAMKREILALARTEPNPHARAFLEREARRVVDTDV